MSAALTCPACKATLRPTSPVPAGKKVRCPKCRGTFVVEGAAAPAETALTTKPGVRPVVEDDIPEVQPVDQLEEVSERPRRRAAARPRDEDEDDAFDDRPRRRTPARKESGGVSVALVAVSVGVGLLLVCGGLGGVGYLLFSSGSSSKPPIGMPAAVAPPVGNPPAPAPAPALAGDAIPAATLDRLKDATVFVKRDAGNRSATGSGFVLQANGAALLIVTNDHVITPEAAPPRGFGRLRQPAPPVRVSVVFRSGTPREQTVAAEVVAADGELDLAILRVTGVREAPPPIDLNATTKLTETMPLYLFGFPFGQALALDKGNPAVTVGKGSVSSLRRDERGDLATVQVDGDLNPGNSGGPVVDAQGRLIGVAVATVRGTRIGMAIPTAELTSVLAGRVRGAAVFSRRGNQLSGEQWSFDRLDKVSGPKSLQETVNGGGPAGQPGEVEIEARLADPLKKLKSVSVLYAKAGGAAARLGPDGRWGPLPEAQKLDLRIEEQRALGVVAVPEADRAATFTFQIVYTNGDGAARHTQPKSSRVDGAAPPVAGGMPPFPGGFPGFPPGLGGLPDFPAEKTVTLRITGVTNAATRQTILDRLPGLIGGNNHKMSSSSTGATTVVTLAPVDDVKAFAAKIDFGTVMTVRDREIVIRAKKVEAPGGGDAVAAAVQQLKGGGDIFQRKAAAETLADAEPKEAQRKEVLATLTAFADDKDTFVRQAVLKALGTWGTKETVPVLAGVLADTEIHSIFARKAALEALGRIGGPEAAEAAAPQLVDFHARAEAVTALEAIGALAEKPVLKLAIFPDGGLRMEICRLLAKFGTKESLPTLQQMARDSNPGVKQAAADAIRAIQGRKP